MSSTNAASNQPGNISQFKENFVLTKVFTDLLKSMNDDGTGSEQDSVADTVDKKIGGLMAQQLTGFGK